MRTGEGNGLMGADRAAAAGANVTASIKNTGNVIMAAGHRTTRCEIAGSHSGTAGCSERSVI